jgi:hypothetical protein
VAEINETVRQTISRAIERMRIDRDRAAKAAEDHRAIAANLTKEIDDLVEFLGKQK